MNKLEKRKAEVMSLAYKVGKIASEAAKTMKVDFPDKSEKQLASEFLKMCSFGVLK